MKNARLLEAQLEQDLKKYPYEVAMFLYPHFTEAKRWFTSEHEAVEYAKACWECIQCDSVAVYCYTDQMIICEIFFDAFCSNGYSKYDEIKDYKEDYEIYYGRPCMMSDEEILQSIYDFDYAWA